MSMMLAMTIMPQQSPWHKYRADVAVPDDHLPAQPLPMANLFKRRSVDRARTRIYSTHPHGLRFHQWARSSLGSRGLTRQIVIDAVEDGQLPQRDPTLH